MDPLIELTESSLTLLLLGAVILFSMGVGILVFYVALPAMRLAKMVKRNYGARLGPDLGKLSLSELKFLLLSFEKMLSDLESQEARVRGLAAAVAHETRNSAAAIRAVAERLPRSAGKSAKAIRDESSQLERMAKAFLDFTRPIEPHFQETNLGDLARSLAKIQAPEAKRRKVRLQVQSPEKAIMMGDPGLLRQMLGNLISNALRAAPRGGRVLTRLERGPEASTWLLRVIDNGLGVPEKIREKLFEPFSGGTPGGTGLGLAIARRIAQAHGGGLELEETAEPGAVFRVVLPQRPPSGLVKAGKNWGEG